MPFSGVFRSSAKKTEIPASGSCLDADLGPDRHVTAGAFVSDRFLEDCQGCRNQTDDRERDTAHSEDERRDSDEARLVWPSPVFDGTFGEQRTGIPVPTVIVHVQVPPASMARSDRLRPRSWIDLVSNRRRRSTRPVPVN